MDSPSNNLLSSLSLNDLETLIQTIVQRILRSELQQMPAIPTQPTQTGTLLDTFGTWEDDRPAATIVNEMYSSRTMNSREACLSALPRSHPHQHPKP
jgi:hypothetical protein